jgi:hypothetical protein
MKEMEEWSVKIFCDRRILREQIDEISKDAAILEEKIMASSPGKAYLLQRRKTDLVKIEMERICNDLRQSFFNKFRNLSDLCIMDKLITREFSEKNSTLILNISLLINRKKVGKLKSISEALGKNYGRSGFYIEISGPLTPCNIVDIKRTGSDNIFVGQIPT